MQLKSFQPRAGGVVTLMTVLTIVAAVGLTVSPWPRDGWYQTQYFLWGHFPGQDNCTPIAAPALFYAAAHALAAAQHWGFETELRLVSALQNLLVLLSACCVYGSLRLLRIANYAAPIAIAYLLLILSTGVAQAFWSETVVLFLISAVILVVAATLRDATTNAVRFWWLAIAAGVLIALAVVTRVTPVLLIPVIAVLLLRHVPARRALQFTGVVIVVTSLAVVGSMAANHARFGRYEIVNSTGRHLWQGIKDFPDRALSDSKTYEVLKGSRRSIQGQNWWQLEPLLEDERADPREPLYREMARQTIRQHPMLFLAQGAKKFARTIGIVPFRLGYGQPGRYSEGCARPDFHAGRSCRSWNPLHREHRLPSDSSVLGASPTFSRSIESVIEWLHALYRYAYPVTIFAILVTYVALIKDKVMRPGRPSTRRSRTLSRAAFLLAGLPAAMIPIFIGGLELSAIVAAAGLVAVLALLSAMRPASKAGARSGAPDFTTFSIFAAIFFGTLAFSWLVEVGNPRNTLPYLPVWAMLLAMSLDFWMRRRAAAVNPSYPASAGSPAAGPDSSKSS